MQLIKKKNNMSEHIHLPKSQKPMWESFREKIRFYGGVVVGEMISMTAGKSSWLQMTGDNDENFKDTDEDIDEDLNFENFEDGNEDGPRFWRK